MKAVSRRKFMAATAAAASGLVASAATGGWPGPFAARPGAARRRAKVARVNEGAIVLREDFLRHFFVVSVAGRRLSVDELERI